MADKEKNVVLNFKMDGQVQYADTLKEINAVMNTAAKEYKNHIAAMGKDAKVTDKLAGEKKKLEIQMEAAEKRTGMLRAQYEAMSKDTKTTTGQLTQMYSKLLDAEKAETSLQKAMERVNDGLSDQAQETRDAEDALNELKSESERLEAENNKLISSFKLQESQLGENASEAEKVGLAQRQLKNQMALAEKAAQNLEGQLRQTKKIYGENSIEVLKMEGRLNEARTTINKFKKSLDGIEESGKDAKKSLDGVGQGFQALAGAAPAAAIAGITSSTQEAAIQLAILETQAKNAGLALSDFEGSQNMFASVNQDVGQVTEAMGNLVQAGYTTQQQLDGISKSISGAIVSYGETFTAEGLAESITTTTQLGEVTGQLTDLLEKSGVDVEKFNTNMRSFSTAQDRARYITQLLADEGLSRAYDEYVKMNPEVVAAAEAQRVQEAALTELGNVLRPLITEVAEFTTKIIEWATEHTNLTAGIAAGAAAIGGMIAVITLAIPVMSTISMVAGAMGISIGAATLPIIAIIAAIAAVIAAGVLLYKNWDTITQKAGEMTITAATKITSLKNKGIALFNEFKDGTLGKINELKAGATLAVSAFKNNVVSKVSGLKSDAINQVNGLKDGAIGKFNNLRDKAGSVMRQAKDNILSPIEEAKDKVGGIVEKITGFFSNMKLKIPKPSLPSLPHFSLEWGSKTIMGKKISYPSGIDVDWRAKGAIFTQPTIFGQYGGRLQGAGDAGPEAALPLNEQTLGDIGRGIASTMGDAGGVVEVHVYLDTEEVTTKLAPGMSKKINKNNKINARSQGVIVT
jgi:phage-related minor tail protein